MSSVVQIFSDVRRLLDALPEVKVAGSHISGDVAIFEIESNSAGEALVVQQLCEAANVSFEPAVRSHEPDLRGTITQVLSASTQGFDTIQHGNLQLLAVHLIWHLHDICEIQTHVANKLLDTWHGARVGA
ncbi:hypothetical protein [Xanthomonas tesorieronis]|uniref:hypothetical protein n=1 Tax=Xanthomonas tesorieronis TaxID=3160839 RepID=UPI003515807C